MAEPQCDVPMAESGETDRPVEDLDIRMMALTKAVAIKRDGHHPTLVLQTAKAIEHYLRTGDVLPGDPWMMPKPAEVPAEVK